MSADYSFDGEKHAQTNGDIDEGGAALHQSNRATHQLNSAQTITRWTGEQGAQDFRSNMVRFFSSVDEMLSAERSAFDTFQANLTAALRDAENTEEANIAALEAINAALLSGGAVAAGSAVSANSPLVASSTPPEDVPTAAGAMPEF